MSQMKYVFKYITPAEIQNQLINNSNLGGVASPQFTLWFNMGIQEINLTMMSYFPEIVLENDDKTNFEGTANVKYMAIPGLYLMPFMVNYIGFRQAATDMLDDWASFYQGEYKKGLQYIAMAPAGVFEEKYFYPQTIIKPTQDFGQLGGNKQFNSDKSVKSDPGIKVNK